MTTMNARRGRVPHRGLDFRSPFLRLALGLALLAPVEAFALSITVEAPDGTAITNYRWLVEEDTTYGTVPGVSCMPGQDIEACHSTGFHRSYAPVVASGHSADAADAARLAGLDPARRYFVSVLPDDAHLEAGFSNGGAGVRAGQAAVTITVQRNALRTAQIRVFVFHDDFPINNAPDLPAEVGLENFEILLFDAGGRYGMSGGQMMQDAFGNPLGTTYNPDGSVRAPGSGRIWTDAQGYASIKNLYPGKYGIQIVPPAGQGWQQTSTIEGTKTIDAWVKAGEPPYFTEFGPPGPHVFVGFVKEFRDATVLSSSGGHTIRGEIRSIHNSRPPDFTFYTGAPVPNCWVGLNQGVAGVGRGLTAVPCAGDSSFEISGVPPGDYGLAVWDANLDFIFSVINVTVTDHDVDLLDVPIFDWFAHLHATVFDDRDEDGFRDEGEPGLPNVPVNLRWRDGSMYQGAPTDLAGEIPFDEVFPFFNWLVAEVDFGRMKATGATVVVDAGGPVNADQGWAYPSDDRLSPQPQCTQTLDDGTCVGPIDNPNTGNNLSRTVTGPVLLEAFQGFLGQTSKIDFGKAAYGPGENGGISGMVQYAVTRAEDDPRYAAAEPWEPGVPRVQVALYVDHDRDGSIDDIDGDGSATLADADNYPFGWRSGGVKGDEDVDRDGQGGAFDPGDAVQIVTTDSWDDSLPTACQGPTFVANPDSAHPAPRDCYDGMRMFNQVREGVFDGGFAFTSYVPTGLRSGAAEVSPIKPDTYIVEAATPPDYETLKEEDRNVDFGVPVEPNPEALPPACVGDLHTVPNRFSLFPLEDENGQPVEPFRSGQQVPYCDRKQVPLKTGQNAAVNFFVFTDVPVAAHLTGFILDDLSNEFDPAAPTFGEKYSPPFLPVSIRDFSGREIHRVYSDRWGSYNALVPSTYTNNVGMPSGVSPNMLIACMNSPGPIANPAFDPVTNPDAPRFITDPHFQKQYSQFCYTFQYMPGTTTYLDTPVVPVAAFAGPNRFPVDCEFPSGTPVVYTASGPLGGPYASSTGQDVTITALGPTDVPNPEFDGTSNAPTLTRDFGFGNVQGSVRIGAVLLPIKAWSAGAITATLPSNVRTGQLTVTRGDNGVASPIGVTFSVGPLTLPGGGAANVHHVSPATTGWPAHPIQDAIDRAAPGDLILVAPGTYEELVVVWKNVRLQGWGPFATTINAVKAPGEKLQAWRDKLRALIDGGLIDLLPSQEVGWALPEPTTFLAEEGPGIIVVARNTNRFDAGGFVSTPNARVDGFGVTGADHGGGIMVSAYARFLELSNNRVFGNHGTYGGGIRVGHPVHTVETDAGIAYDDAQNRSLNIHNNMIVGNGGGDGAGGGISLNHGSDSYRVERNWVCGNFTQGHGGGIGHLGYSNNGRIAANSILFNESFNQGVPVNGGGVYIGGGDPLNGPGSLAPGSGSVKVLGNLVLGNLAGAGDGGGVRLQRVNGTDVANRPGVPSTWNRVDLYNNMIVNNVAGLAGGGLSLQDAARVLVVNNTIQNNDSTATAGGAFGDPNVSTPQPAGVVSRAHTPELAAAFAASTRDLYGVFSNAVLENTIVRHNRSFRFVNDVSTEVPTPRLLPDIAAGDVPVYDDLAVVGTAQPRRLSPRYCLLSETTPAGTYDASNVIAPASATVSTRDYVNGNRGQTIQQPEIKSTLAAQPAFDEGGNFITVRFGPLSLVDAGTGAPYGDYHLAAGSVAIDVGPATVGNVLDLLRDFDGDRRPTTATRVDIGADEWVPPAPAAAAESLGGFRARTPLATLLPGYVVDLEPPVVDEPADPAAPTVDGSTATGTGEGASSADRGAARAPKARRNAGTNKKSAAPAGAKKGTRR